MQMQTRRFDLLRASRERGLVDAHAVGKRGAEEIVVAPCSLGYAVGEMALFGGCEVGKGADGARVWNDEGFEGPDGPPGTEEEEGGVRIDDAGAGGGL